MKKRFTEFDEEREAVIDVTPMLDVVFIMLIFFIVTATFVREVGINLPVPSDSNSGPINAHDNILIEIKPDDRTYVKGRDVDVRRITANIQQLKSVNPEAKVVIKASKRSKNNTLVQVMDSVQQAGILDLSLTNSSE